MKTNKFIKTFCIILVLLLLLNQITVFSAVQGWTLSFNNTVKGEVIQATDEKHSGNVSARLINETARSANNYILFLKSWTAVQESKYRVTFWIKSENCANSALRVFGNVWNDSTSHNVAVSGNRDWREVAYTFTANGSGGWQLCYLMEDIGIVWIDDISVDMVNDSGEVIRNIFNEGFETGADLIPPANVTNASVKAGFDTLHVSWENPTDSDFNGVHIYQKIDDETFTLLDKVPPSQTSAVISGVEPNTQHLISLKSVDYTGNQSQGTDISADTKAYDISAPIVTEFKEGEVTAGINVKNASDSPFKTALIIALFDGQKMIDLTQCAEDVEKTTGEGRQLQASLTVPKLSTGNYRINVYTWNSILKMKALMVKTVKTPQQ